MLGMISGSDQLELRDNDLDGHDRFLVPHG
jgi:hypothetical protein